MGLPDNKAMRSCGIVDNQSSVATLQMRLLFFKKMYFGVYASCCYPVVYRKFGLDGDFFYLHFSFSLVKATRTLRISLGNVHTQHTLVLLQVHGLQCREIAQRLQVLNKVVRNVELLQL